ncbi:MAG: glucose-6-phosphate isomerase [Gemmatimonadota bacterium]
MTSPAAPPVTLHADGVFGAPGSALAQHGLDRAWVRDLAPRFREIAGAVQSLRREGVLGFYDLVRDDDELVPQILRFAEGAGQAFESIAVLGIGGSALAARAIQTALLPPFWNELDDEARSYYPRAYVLDNIDPGTFGPLLRRVDLRRTLFNVVSKSGKTTETLAQFLVVRAALEAELGDGWRRHVVITTDPTEGPLRRFAQRETIATLPIPPNVGGRFSALSAVGLLPAALTGVDVRALRAGAGRMAEACAGDDLESNPAGLLAALLHLADLRRGARIHVFMPYTDRLRDTAAWFAQLWAESLGKRSGDEGRAVGPTPVAALGATDQHSQLQLYMEGPRDKVVCFVTVDEDPEDVEIPAAPEPEAEWSYLHGHTLGAVLRAEQAATEEALARAGRMSLRLSLPRVDAESLGALMMGLEIATVYAGQWYGVNPLDQPGVELGKRLTRERLSRGSSAR